MQTFPYEGIRSPVRLRNGKYMGCPGTFWAWEVDGYFDIHHSPADTRPDGSDVIAECFDTLLEVKQYVREIAELNRWGI